MGYMHAWSKPQPKSYTTRGTDTLNARGHPPLRAATNHGYVRESEGANLHRGRATFHIQVSTSKTPRTGEPFDPSPEVTIATDQTREVYVRKTTTAARGD